MNKEYTHVQKAFFHKKIGRLDPAYCRIKPPSGAGKGGTPYVPKKLAFFKNFYIVNEAA
jgi:hypothetical protein